MSDVWASDVETGRFTLLALADNANDPGICWPGAALLASKTGKSRSSVFRDLKALEGDGLIERRRRRRKNGSLTSNLYIINLDLLRSRRRKTTADERAEIEEMLRILAEETDPAELEPA